MSGLSYAQFVGSQVVSFTASALSVVGSSLILVSIFKQQSLSFLANDTLHQFLVGLSIADIIATITVGTGAFWIPVDRFEDNPWAIGNETTCSIAAFFYVCFATIASFYSCFMSIYFWRTIRSSRRTSTAGVSEQCFRIGAHVVSLLLPLALSSVGFVTNTYHTQSFARFCYYGKDNKCAASDDQDSARVWGLDDSEDGNTWIKEQGNGNPDLWEDEEFGEESSDDCDKSPRKLLNLFRTAVITLLALISIFCTVSVACTVRATLRKSQRYSSRTLADDLRESVGTLSEPRQSRKESQKEQEVAAQAIWYTVAYINSFFFLIVTAIVLNLVDAPYAKFAEPGFYAMLLLTYMTIPLQGALNFIVFIRPRYNAWRQHLSIPQGQRSSSSAKSSDQFGDDTDNPTTATVVDSPWWFVLRKAILEPIPTSSVRRSRMNAKIPTPVPESVAS